MKIMFGNVILKVEISLCTEINFSFEYNEQNEEKND